MRIANSSSTYQHEACEQSSLACLCTSANYRSQGISCRKLKATLYNTVVAIIGLNALGAFAANGAQALTWIVISAVTFFSPTDSW